ncbi:MAG: hypothetical protein ACRENC_12655, partial [Gemmatimonadaceae bacterium]
MFRILHDTTIDFIRLWKITTAVTLAFAIPGLIWIAVSNYKYSIEFTGGTLMQVAFNKTPDAGDLRSTLDRAGVHGAEIVQFGTSSEFMIRAQDAGEVAQQAHGANAVAMVIEAALTKQYGTGSYAVRSVDTVGPKVGGELRQKAFYAIL